MKLFLCSHFSSVGSLIKEEIENKKVAFIPTASLREGYTGYVGSARKLFKKLGAIVTEIDISTEAYSTIQSVFEEADVIYFTGGNSFFLMDQLRKTGTDELLKKELEKGKLMIGESAGAIICAPTIQYIEQMDEKQTKIELKDLVSYQEGQVVSKTLVQNDYVSMTIFSFDKGEEISTHAAGGDAMVTVLEGKGRFTVADEVFYLEKGETLIMPKDIPHAVYGEEKFKMQLVVSY
jgi:dipeptidase E